MCAFVIDADGHVDEDLAWMVAALDPSLRALAPTAQRGDDGTLTTLIEGRPWKPEFPYPSGSQTHTSAGGEYRAGGRDPHMRLEALDEEGIDIAVLYPSLGLMFGLYQDPEVAAAMCAVDNDWLASFCAKDPDRLVGVALLPQQDPDRAARELARCVEQHGFVAGMIRPNRIGGRTVDDDAFEPVWATAESLDVPITLHEAYLGGIETVGLERVSSYAGAHVISHPFEQMAAMLGLSLAGVFARHPGLRFGFFETGCSWAPYWCERIEEHYELAPADFRGGDPGGVLSTRAWLTFDAAEAGVQATAGLGWANQLCFASDFPHFDAVFPGAVNAVRAREFGRDLERKLLGDNALAFYGDRLRERAERVEARR